MLVALNDQIWEILLHQGLCEIKWIAKVKQEYAAKESNICLSAKQLFSPAPPMS